MEYCNKPCLGNCGSCFTNYQMNDYLAVKPVEYEPNVENYFEKVDYSIY